MFIPWTQNIRAKGYVIGLKPEQRPQDVQSVIGGKIEQWYVKEGDLVSKGDTLMFLSEVKAEYFDPELVRRTEEQVEAKAGSIDAYLEKVGALDRQYDALVELRDLKLEQGELKLKQLQFKLASDSANLVAERINLEVAEAQLLRMEEMYKEGLQALTDLERRRLKKQEVQAKVINLENKFFETKNEILNAKVNLSTLRSEYAEKLSKVRSDRSSALGSKLDAEANTAKLRNMLKNYDLRQGFYYITAPQPGYVTKVIKSGVGEIIKEGEKVLTIMPEKYDLAVETYVRPIDLPLIKIGQNVRIQFDGWPAIVFSGWPNTSFGTYSGSVIAVDNYISENGKYRLIVAPDEPEKPWPDLLRVGSGANTITLLEDVPIWYELWRQLNGFPPDYYDELPRTGDLKLKAPLRSVK
jgi:multidrug resistance efflux pump